MTNRKGKSKTERLLKLLNQRRKESMDVTMHDEDGDGVHPMAEELEGLGGWEGGSMIAEGTIVEGTIAERDAGTAEGSDHVMKRFRAVKMIKFGDISMVKAAQDAVVIRSGNDAVHMHPIDLWDMVSTDRNYDEDYGSLMAAIVDLSAFCDSVSFSITREIGDDRSLNLIPAVHAHSDLVDIVIRGTPEEMIDKIGEVLGMMGASHE